jgi:hypothetical protein
MDNEEAKEIADGIEEQKVEHHVIDKIKRGETKMRSRSYFVTQTVLMAVSVVVILGAVFFLVSFMVYALETNGGFFAIHFGFSGVETFFGSLPWTLLLLSIALLLILVLLLKRYEFVYHQPILYLLAILFIVVCLAGFLIAASSLHSIIYRDAEGGRGSMVGGIYQFETTPAGNIYRGQAVVIAEGGFILANAIGQTSTVIMSPQASSELQDITIGEYVIIFGHRIATGTIEAFGVEAATQY